MLGVSQRQQAGFLSSIALLIVRYLEHMQALGPSDEKYFHSHQTLVCSSLNTNSERLYETKSTVLLSEKHLQACSLRIGNPDTHNSIERSIKYSILSHSPFVNPLQALVKDFGQQALDVPCAHGPVLPLQEGTDVLLEQ